MNASSRSESGAPAKGGVYHVPSICWSRFCPGHCTIALCGPQVRQFAQTHGISRNPNHLDAASTCRTPLAENGSDLTNCFRIDTRLASVWALRRFRSDANKQSTRTKCQNEIACTERACAFEAIRDTTRPNERRLSPPPSTRQQVCAGFARQRRRHEISNFNHSGAMRSEHTHSQTERFERK